jgi:hypothetical protein
VSRLENHSWLIGRLFEWDAKLEELQENVAEVLEESVIVLGVLLNEDAHGLVLDEGHVCREHHQALACLVLILEQLVNDLLCERPVRLDLPASGRSTCASSTSPQEAVCSSHW